MGSRWLSRKTTVEECLTLDINKLVTGGFLQKSFGELRWVRVRGGEETANVSYSLRDVGGSVYILTLHSPIIHRGQHILITQNIPLVTTIICSGGKRHWFSCPNCRRRVGRLHLPRGMSYFFCRTCYDLTYTSCQESHTLDWFFAQIGVPPSVGRRLFRRN